MKKILVALFMFCQFSFLVEALDYFEEFEESIETLDKLDKLDEVETLDEVEVLDELDEVEELDRTDETIKSKSFYEIEYDDLFFEMGILYNLYNKDDTKPMLGMGVETKYKNSYIIFQNCIDLVYLASTKNNADFVYTDFVWTPTFFLGNSIIKIGVGTPLGIGVYIYGDNLSSFISIGARFSIKLTILHISLEAYYQNLEKGALGSDYTIESNEFGLTLKISMDAHW